MIFGEYVFEPLVYRVKDFSPIRDKYELHKNTDVDAARKESNYVNYYVAQHAASVVRLYW